MRTTSLLRLLSAALLLLGPAAKGLPAQPTAPHRDTLPKGMGWIEANGATHIPFGLRGGISQQVWDAGCVPGSGASSLISAFSLRRDGSGTACGPFWVECETALSSTSRPAANMSATFASNVGKDYTMVIPRRRLNFPATTPAAKPDSFLAPFPFSQPFLFLRPQAAGLLLEIRVFSAAPSSPGRSFTLDALGPATSTAPPRGVSAPGCRAAPAGKPLACTLALGGTGGAKLTITVREAPANAPLALFLGRSGTRWGGLALPLDLGPLGAPGCHAYVEYLFHLAGSAGGRGTWSRSLAVPSALPPALPIYGQAYVSAPGINPLGLAASNGAAVLTPGAAPTAWLHDANSPVAITGTLQKNAGPVIALDYL